MGDWIQADQGTDLAAILELTPGRELHGEGPGGVDVDAFQSHQSPGHRDAEPSNNDNYTHIGPILWERAL